MSSFVLEVSLRAKGLLTLARRARNMRTARLFLRVQAVVNFVVLRAAST